MKRRSFIQQVSLIGGGLIILPRRLYAFLAEATTEWFRLIVSEIKYPHIVFPNEKRVPLGWKAFPVSGTNNSDNAVFMRFPDIIKTKDPVWLRITAAIDFREELEVSVYLLRTSFEIGRFDIRYAHPFQPFQIKIDPKHISDINSHGIALRMVKGEKNAWFFNSDSSMQNNEGLQPHFLIGNCTDPEDSFRKNLLSMNSFSPFGWIGGCVHDALWEMSKIGDPEALEVLKMHLDAYLDIKAGVIYENPMTEPRDGTFNSIEDFLPFAAIANLYPEHLSIQNALDYLLSKENPDGCIISGSEITTEGCYTVAYPMAVIAVKTNNPELAEKALEQLRCRTPFLTDETTIYQRSTVEGNRHFANWGRGAVWYLLGFIKTLAVFEDSQFKNMPGLKELQNEFIRATGVVVQWQTKEGHWCSFIDRPECGIDTSATAGIAIALAWGCKMKLLEAHNFEKAKKAYQTLLPYLTPDGFLTGISQINRGGEALQAGDYRVISQFGSGLMAQLQLAIK